MYRDDLAATLRELIEKYLLGQGVELVELILRRQGRGLYLGVLADLPEGNIDIGTCARLNRELGMILEEKNIMPEFYTLEVASPGLDRPLATKADFLRCLKREVVFFLSSPVKDKIEWQGLIKSVSDEAVLIERAGEEFEIPLSSINKGKQIIKDI